MKTYKLYNEHVNNLSVCQINVNMHTNTIQVAAWVKPAKLQHACPQDFTSVTVFLVIQWTFQSERQFTVGSLLFTVLWITDNSRQVMP